MTAPVFSNFVMGCFDITLQAQKSFSLPPMPGPVFRASFSNLMRQITCENTTLECSLCQNRKQCAFFWLYQNSGEFGEIQLDRFRTPPKPFVLAPPIQKKPQYFRHNDPLALRLVLFGEALNFIPQLTSVFREMGKNEFNNISAPFSLKNFVGINPLTGNTTSFSSLKPADIYNCGTTFDLPAFIEYHKAMAPISNVTVTFKTPTRIKGSGSFSKAISFKVLMQTLLTRITTLAYNYCHQTHYLNFRDLVNLAHDIQIVDEQENPDFSTKTVGPHKHRYLGGYVGKITYHGDLTPFWPWLKLAEIIHLGKNCTFGLGKIQATL